MMLVAAMLNDASIEHMPGKTSAAKKKKNSKTDPNNKPATLILLKATRKEKQTHAFIETC